MKFSRLIINIISCSFILLHSAQAENTNTQPAKIIVGFSAGGTLDVVARALADSLRDTLGRTVTVENKPGAGGRIGIDALLKSPADGNVVMLCPDSYKTMYPFVFRKLNYSPDRDIIPVSTVAEFPMAIAVPFSSPVKSFSEYTQWVRTHPEAANFGHAAAGGPTHLLGVQVGKVIGTQLDAVSYQGAAPMITSLIGGNIAAGSSTVGDFAQYHRSNKLRVLAVTSRTRSPLLPEVPTFNELGLKELSAVGVLAICIAPGTTASVISEWSNAVHKAADSENFASKIRSLGFSNTGSSASDANSKFEMMRQFWEPIVTTSGFKAD